MSAKPMIYLLGPEHSEDVSQILRANSRELADKFVADGWREVTVEEFDRANPDSDDAVLRRLEKVVKKHQDQQRWHAGNNLAEQVEEVMRHYKGQAVAALTSSKEFRDDMLSWLRGMAIVADMTSQAGTHREKDARLRGMVEVIDSAIRKLREEEYKFTDSYWRYDDVFRSDYPVRHYKERIYELEAEVEQLKKSQANGNQEVDA